METRMNTLQSYVIYLLNLMTSQLWNVIHYNSLGLLYMLKLTISSPKIKPGT